QLAAYQTFEYQPDLDGAPWFVPTRVETTFQCEASPCSWSRVENRLFDAFGNPIEVVESGDDGLARTTWSSFLSYADGRWLLSLKASNRLYAGVHDADDGQGLLRETLADHDSRGNMTLNRVRVSDGIYGATSHEYDAFGNETRTVDPLGNSTITR